MLLTNTFETGIAPGTTITTANSDDNGAGDAFQDAVVGASGSLTFDNAQVAHGSLSAKIAQGASSADKFLGWQFSAATALWSRFYIYIPSFPASSNLHIVFGWTGSGYPGFITLATDGTLRIVDSTFTERANSTITPSIGWNRIEWRYVAGTVSGWMECKLFKNDTLEGTTPSQTFGGAGATGNFGASVTEMGMSSINTGGVNASYAYWVDTIELNDTGYPGPSAPATLIPNYNIVNFAQRLVY